MEIKTRDNNSWMAKLRHGDRQKYSGPTRDHTFPVGRIKINSAISAMFQMLCPLSVDRPKITSFKCSNRTDDTIVLVCEVECYLPYNITWLYGGENIALLLNGAEKYFMFCNDTKSFLLVRNASNSDTKKSYTCVVDTSYRKGDAMKVFSFCKLSSSA